MMQLTLLLSTEELIRSEGRDAFSSVTYCEGADMN